MTAVAQAFDTTEREIIVAALHKMNEGRTNGRGWVLNAVRASELDGTEIAVPLRTFDRLEGTERVTFEPYPRDGAIITHYTLKRVRTADDVRASRDVARAAVMGEPAPRVEIAGQILSEQRFSDLTRELETAVARIDALEGRFELLASLLGRDA
jgi:hypothetical protein